MVGILYLILFSLNIYANVCVYIIFIKDLILDLIVDLILYTN